MLFCQKGEKPYKIVKGRPKRVRTVMICFVNLVVGIAFKLLLSCKILPIRFFFPVWFVITESTSSRARFSDH